MKREHRDFESRFQRLAVLGFESWGDAPGYDEGAPSALQTTAGYDEGALSAFQTTADYDEVASSALMANPRCMRHHVVSVNGAAFNASLGRRPRALIQSKLSALKARFIREVSR